MAGFTLEQLKLAFTWHVARRVIDADGATHQDEAAWLAERFPADQLTRAGFIDTQGAPTSTFENALAEALEVLPTALHKPGRLALLETFLGASLADQELHHTEWSVLLEAAQQLGIQPHEFDAHLDTLDEVGSVDLGGETP